MIDTDRYCYEVFVTDCDNIKKRYLLEPRDDHELFRFLMKSLDNLNNIESLEIYDLDGNYLYEGSRWDDGRFDIGTACQSKYKLDYPHIMVNP